MSAPLNPLNFSSTGAIQALDRDREIVTDRPGPAEARDPAWFLPRNTTSLSPIGANPLTELSDASPDAMADRVLSHLSV